MRTLTIYLTLFTGALLFLGFTAFSLPGDDDGVCKTNKDVIKFTHELHAAMSECADCHTGAAESTSLQDRMLPEKEVCETCHDVEDSDNCTLCHYDGVFEPMIQKKSELLFDHKFHINSYELECTECHKGFEEAAYSFEASQPVPPMEQCYVCHNDYEAGTDECAACHISTANLVPEDHLTNSFFDNHKFTSHDGNCAMCHDESFCESCHVSTTGIDEANTATDFYTPYTPDKYIDNTKLQNITRVHDLNYRYTHGIDAKGYTSECVTCHTVESFCAECHTSGGGDYALSGVVPYSHLQPDFVTVGVGSGGGEHGIEARRDIESCAACHDTQGADPNCILCHVDNDGIQGTNPKTHPTDYMTTENGDWHNSMGSVCYNCHTDPNAHPGGVQNMGFCGYCHN